MPAITSEAVREILTAGGHAEWVRGEVTGFRLGESGTEVLVERLRGADMGERLRGADMGERLRGADMGEPYTEDVKTAEQIELTRYCNTLREAGYKPDRAWRTHGYRMIVLAKGPAGA